MPTEQDVPAPKKKGYWLVMSRQMISKVAQGLLCVMCSADIRSMSFLSYEDGALDRRLSSSE
jgi:hypothetical protein